MNKQMRDLSLLILASLALGANSAFAFCGFYVAKADAELYNKASQVVLVRDGDRTVISMMNDYQGSPADFAMVVPVPEKLDREQINVGDRALFERIDAYSAPRLVEYFDSDPCMRRRFDGIADLNLSMSAPMAEKMNDARARSLGVKVEAEYTIGEYDIVILSAKESSGLETWLRENEYRIPKGASEALKPYILQNMKFFVAKVNLEEQARAGLKYLRPLQFAFNSEKFMLPIRLGLINANGPQELLLYVLTKNGRVETTNYRTIKLPTGMELPGYIKEKFGDFYRAMFDEQVKRNGARGVFTEYFWNMGWCDPCAANPLSPEELKKLGVFWLDEPTSRYQKPQIMPRVGAVPVMITRLHIRYDAESFPEDLMFHETGDKQNFQGRYVIRHPWKGEPNQCPAAKNYFNNLVTRQDKEVKALANLTGWDVNEIRSEIPDLPPAPNKQESWWKKLWE